MSHDHAVVIGGSFAGCTAARVLSDHFDRVTIVDRDEFPEDWAPRKGVPQSPHVHGILKLGRETLDQLLPGFIKDTEGLGAVLFDQVASGAAFTPYGWCARGRSKVLGYGVRRALLEHVVRQRVTALENVDLVQGRAQGLVVNRPGGRVQGLNLTDSKGVSQIEADLVVDAGGRASPAPRWLEESGHTPPDESVVNGLVGYASRWIRVPDDAWPSPGDMRFVAQLPMLGCTKGAIVYPQDNGLHVVSLFGQSRDYPPGDEIAFMAFLEQCATPMMHHVVSRSEVVSGISTSRSTANRWRHYEHLAEPATGFVALGDAMASFNPIFGQGVTGAVMGASMLGDALIEVDGNLDILPRIFQPRLAAQLAYPWQTAVGFDLSFPETVGDRPQLNPSATEARAYLEVLGQLATSDASVFEAILLANQTFDRSGLYDARLVEKAKAWVHDGRTPSTTDPLRPPALQG